MAYDCHIKHIPAFHQAHIGFTDLALCHYFAVEQRADGFEVKYHAHIHVADEHRIRFVVRFALRVDGRAFEFLEETIIDIRGLLAVMQERNALAVRQTQDQDLRIPIAEFFEDGRLTKTIIRTVRRDLICKFTYSRHGIDRVVHPFGTRIGAHKFSQHTHLRRRAAIIPCHAFEKIIIERRHDERAFRPDHVKQRIDHRLRSAVHTAE